MLSSNEILTIHNDGSAIVSTNYWESDLASCGGYYLSWNADAARLLVPPSKLNDVAEMATSKVVILSRGHWTEAKGDNSWEIMFEDHSDSPFALWISEDTCDRLLPKSSFGRKTSILVYAGGDLVLERPAFLRTAKHLPCMLPLPKA